jgi:hypothetical protein
MFITRYIFRKCKYVLGVFIYTIPPTRRFDFRYLILPLLWPEKKKIPKFHQRISFNTPFLGLHLIIYSIIRQLFPPTLRFSILHTYRSLSLFFTWKYSLLIYYIWFSRNSSVRNVTGWRIRFPRRKAFSPSPTPLFRQVLFRLGIISNRHTKPLPPEHGAQVMKMATHSHWKKKKIVHLFFQVSYR